MDISELLKAKIKDQEAIMSKDKIKVEEVFKNNTKLLKRFIQENGWPSSEYYSEEVSFAAWLIAQHSDHDPMFQLQCLSLMISHNYQDKETMKNIAFLLDRVLVNMKQKQIFGTQLNGKFTIPETISPTKIDSLRRKFGLEPIKDYIKRVMDFAEKQEV